MSAEAVCPADQRGDVLPDAPADDLEATRAVRLYNQTASHRKSFFCKALPRL